MATKKRVTKRKVSAKSSKKTQPMQSFRVSPSPSPFLTFKITRQTVYWVVLLSIVVALQLLILKQQMDISNLIDALQIAE